MGQSYNKADRYFNIPIFERGFSCVLTAKPVMEKKPLLISRVTLESVLIARRHATQVLAQNLSKHRTQTCFSSFLTNFFPLRSSRQ